jgi:hypothetical protein
VESGIWVAPTIDLFREFQWSRSQKPPRCATPGGFLTNQR